MMTVLRINLMIDHMSPKGLDSLVFVRVKFKAREMNVIALPSPLIPFVHPSIIATHRIILVQALTLVPAFDHKTSLTPLPSSYSSSFLSSAKPHASWRST